ncbi:MAG: rhomboid family intramembrane serine protease [Terrimicrobiaceae bacterium]|nr:rhomboid family intramembrane serine protease [Terrimicrobiaceae bacterium]
MIAERNFGDDRPVTWIGSFPVYVSTLFAAVHSLTMICTALALAAGAEGLLQALMFSSSAFLPDLKIWQAVTYAFVHSPPYWFFLLELYLLIVFGREVEKFLGRTAFIQLYAGLIFLAPLALSLLGLLGIPSVYAGSGALHFGIFVAFAAIYPRVEIFFGIQARWIAAALLGINAVQYLAFSQFIELGVLLLESAAAVGFVEYSRRGFSFPKWPVRHRLKVVRPTGLVRKTPSRSEPAVTHEVIDPILEKISRSGIGSLTDRERTLLEKARAELIAKEKSL